MADRLRQLMNIFASPDPRLQQSGSKGYPGLAVPGFAVTDRPSMVGTTVTVEAPGIPGETVRFVVLPEGTLIAPASIPDGVLFPIADAVEATVQTPYEVDARRISGDQWGAAATEVETLDVKAGSPGQVLTFSRVGGIESATVDGRDERLPPDFRTLFGGDDDLWVEARRADDTTWVVHRSLL
jgi:hypothetical protein